MSDRIIEVEYDKEEGFTLRIHPKKFQLLPEETREHLRTANREALLALRTLIDRYVSMGEKSGRKTRAKIKVE